MKKRLLAIILSMTLFVLSVVGVGAVDATSAEDTFSVVTMDPETGIESRKVYDVSGNNFELLSETILSITEPINIEGTPVSQVSESNGVTPRYVFGDDDTTLVTNTQIHPYSSIAYLEVVWPNLEKSSGTAFLVSDSVVLTAAHCIYNEEFGGWPLSVAIFPGKYGVGAWCDPYLSTYSYNWSVDDSWLNLERDDSLSDRVKRVQQAPFDWGVLKLTVPLGQNIDSKIQMGFSESPELKNANVKISGYPFGDGILFPKCKQYEMDGTIARSFAMALEINDIDTSEGQSGSPVLINENGKYVAYGILTGHREYEANDGTSIYYNHAVRITDTIYNYVLEEYINKYD